MAFDARFGLLLRMMMCALSVSVEKTAQSASFNVSPIGFELSQERSASVLQIRNTGDESARLQVQALDWSTDGSVEILSNTDALLLNPPIFVIEPGQTQFLRFGLRRPEPVSTEKSYRLVIDEVPPSGSKFPGIQTLLQISIPVFVSPKVQQEKVFWQLTRGVKGLVLVATNDGNVHRKINAVWLSDADNKVSVLVSSPAYVLPGQRKAWPLNHLKIRAGEVRLRVLTDKGEIEKVLTLEADPVSGR